MLNYDSILSALDGKPTLLQWLKMVKKALDESVLKDVTIAKDGDNIAFTFNFEDGTSVTTPKVTLPKGDKGDTGATGPKGDAGVSITGIDTVGGQVVGDETLTTLRARYSNDTSDEFVVKAKNGSSVGLANIYTHSIKIKEDSSGFELYFNIYSTKESLTIDDVFGQIPVNNYIPMCFHKSTEYGIFAIKKTAGNEFLYLIGSTCTADKTIDFYNTAIPKSGLTMVDELLGVNLS